MHGGLELLNGSACEPGDLAYSTPLSTTSTSCVLVVSNDGATLRVGVPDFVDAAQQGFFGVGTTGFTRPCASPDIDATFVCSREWAADAATMAVTASGPDGIRASAFLRTPAPDSSVAASLICADAAVPGASTVMLSSDQCAL